MVVKQALVASIAPDLIQLLPFLVLLHSHDGLSLLWDYIVQPPASQPILPDWLDAASHHLHCTFHSLLAVAAIGGPIVLRWPERWPIIAAWLSHVVIDIFTHSNEFYPVAFLYPLSSASVNGIAWNEPWFIALNYAVLVMVWGGIIFRRTRG
jgi:hypothetical protein